MRQTHDVPIPRSWTSQRTTQTYALAHYNFGSVPVLLWTGHHDFRAPVPCLNRCRSSCFTQGVSATSRHSLPTPAVWDDAKLHVCAVLPFSGFSRWVFGPMASKRNSHTSWKRVRVLPQTNMLEAVITGFHCRRKPSFVAPTVLVSTHRTKRRPTCLSYQFLCTAFG